MLREQCQVGMKVVFGENKGVVTNLNPETNPEKVQIRVFDEDHLGRWGWGITHPEIDLLVPYSMIEPDGGEVEDAGEIIIRLSNGGTLRCGKGEEYEHGGYLSVCDKNGDEIVRWESTEWAEDPEGVIGAVFGLANKPIFEILESLGLTHVEDGCWV